MSIISNRMEYIAPITLSWLTCSNFLPHRRIIQIAISYFISDTVYIITRQKTEYYGYILHHVLASYILGSGLVETESLWRCLFAFEFSNLFLNIWSLTNKLKTYPRLNHILFPLTLCTYVPTRLALPMITYTTFADSWANGYYTICFSHSVLIAMSYFYSFVLLKIALRKLPNYGLDGVKFWSMFTYVFKLYTAFYYARVHNLTIYGIVDVFHIIASWLYNMSDYSDTYQKLDILAIHLKMVSTNITSSAFIGPNVYTLFANFLILAYLVKNYRSINLNKNRNFHLALYTLNCLVSSYNPAVKLDTLVFFLVFIMGGMMWALRIPERFIDTSFTSLPIMHICNIISEVLFCESCLRFGKTIQ